MPKAYEGTQPYAFISYSHKDSAVVMPIVEMLQSRGVLVWYDGGIEAGSEWPEYIASHLKNCACVLSFISENFIDSPNCRRELIFAQNLRKDVLSVFIDDAPLTDGMIMQLGLNQSVTKSNFRTNNDFYDALYEARILNSCKVQYGGERDPEAKSDLSSEEKEKTSVQQAPKTQSKRRKWIVWITSLLEIIYVYFGITTLTELSAAGEGAWGLIWKTAVVHIAFLLLNYSILKLAGEKLPAHEKKDIYMPAACWFALAVLVVMIAGPFCMAYDMNVILKIFASIGLNIIPLIGGIIVYICADYK